MGWVGGDLGIWGHFGIFRLGNGKLENDKKIILGFMSKGVGPRGPDRSEIKL